VRVAICGGGVIGACLAWFLSRRGAEVVVIERTGVACAASGKSGGFLALDWCDGTALGPLARRSFALHAELAAMPWADWGYRRLETLSVAATERRPPVVRGRLGDVATTAQVHPRLFTQGMMQAAIAAGASLRLGRVTGIVLDGDGTTATGVVVGGDVLTADAVVIAMGPWSALASRWLPLPPVYGLKGNSVVLDTGDRVGPQAQFVELRLAGGATHAPEVFPRPDGTTYVCGLSSEQELPEDPAEVAPDTGAPEALAEMIRVFAPNLVDAPVLAAQACYRPVTRDGLPLLGAVPGIGGAYVATGHSVWGILNAPASGEAMAELILDGASRLDLAAFDPGR
jgi:glycine/D-amino acid oxidase-like deaminating enzyme